MSAKINAVIVKIAWLCALKKKLILHD